MATKNVIRLLVLIANGINLLIGKYLEVENNLIALIVGYKTGKIFSDRKPALVRAWLANVSDTRKYSGKVFFPAKFNSETGKQVSKEYTVTFEGLTKNDLVLINAYIDNVSMSRISDTLENQVSIKKNRPVLEGTIIYPLISSKTDESAVVTETMTMESAIEAELKALENSVPKTGKHTNRK